MGKVKARMSTTPKHFARSIMLDLILGRALVRKHAGYLPNDFNVAWLCPKGTKDRNKFCTKGTRPLSGASTDAKCLAFALAHSFNLVIDRWAIRWQSGFVSGRCILHNVMDVESAGLGLCLLSEKASIVMLDFSSAFPSLSRAFAWYASFFIGIPANIILAVKALYDDNWHFINFNGIRKFAFLAQSGVRQGCPLSNTIFLLATDALYRYMDSTLTVMHTSSALMFMVLDICEALPTLRCIFWMFRGARILL